MKNLIKKNFFCAAFVALAGTFALTGCGEKEEAVVAAPQGPVPVAVPVETVAYVERKVVSEMPGRFDAVRVADVSARVTGILLKRKFEEGAFVKKGDVLFIIDPEPLQAACDAAKAQLAGAKAALEGAELTFARYSELVKTGGISRQAYDDSRVAVNSGKAAVLAAQAQLRTAKINLGYATVTAPISGIIGAANVTEGALVSGTTMTKLATIHQMDPIYFDFSRSATAFLEMRKAIANGSIKKIGEDTVPVELILEDGTKYPHTGKLKFSEVSVNKNTGMYTMRAEFPNPDKLLLPGMFARATLTEGIDKQAILVPQKAVSLGTAGKATIFTVGQGDMVIPRGIKIASMQGDKWLIAEGLKPGDRIVADGLIAVGMALQRGTGVKVVPQQKAPAGTEKQAPQNQEKGAQR